MFFDIRKNKVNRTSFELNMEGKTYENIMELLFEDRDFCYEIVYKIPPSGDTIWNRLALILFTPIYLISIPFQYLFRGKIGIDQYGRFGRILKKLIGEF